MKFLGVGVCGELIGWLGYLDHLLVLLIETILTK